MGLKIYHIKITADKYPTDYKISASSWSTAIGRAVKMWQRRFKGSRTQEIRLHAIKGGELLKSTEQE